jgi:hypothetical protein
VPLHRGAALLGLLGSSSNARFCLRLLVLPLSYAPTGLLLFLFFVIQLSPSMPLLVVAHVPATATPIGISEDELIPISSRPSFPIHLLILLRPAQQPDLTLNILLVIVSSFYIFISTFHDAQLINYWIGYLYLLVKQSSMLNGRLLFSTSTSKIDTTDSNKLEKAKGPPQNEVADTKIFRTLASYLWMKDNPEFRLRVLTALAFLVGAKVRSQ